MSESILTHEQKVEKLLSAVVASNGLIIACLVESSSLSKKQKDGVLSVMDNLADAVSECNEDPA